MAQSIGKTNKNGTLNNGAFYSISDVQFIIKGILKNISDIPIYTAGNGIAISDEGVISLDLPVADSTEY